MVKHHYERDFYLIKGGGGGIGKGKLKHALHKLHQITFSAVGTIFIKGDLEL